MKVSIIKIAGLLNLFTAFLHLIGGQISLVDPLLLTSLGYQEKGEWVGVWHIITILLFFTTFILLKTGFSKKSIPNKELLKYIGTLLILCGIPFVISSIYFGVLAPQWILFFPMGLLVLFGIKERENHV